MPRRWRCGCAPWPSVLLATPRLPVVVAAAVVHAELATVRPFVRGNAVVARALDRAVVHAGGLDPTGVAVTEAGHGAQGGAAYLGALTAYGRGDAAGVGLWISHCCSAIVRPPPRGSGWRMPCSPDDSPVDPCRARGPRSRTSGDGPPRGTVTTKLPRTGRVPTRGQSTDGPIVMGSTQYDDGMEHAWSPTRSAAGRRLRPINGTEAPSRVGVGSQGVGAARFAAGASSGCVQVASRQPVKGGQRLNLVGPTFGFRRERGLLRTISTCRRDRACAGTRS